MSPENPTMQSNRNEMKAASPSSPALKWVRGQEIGSDSDSWSRVYLGMNMNTGDLMAVKQLAVPVKSSEEEQYRESLQKAECEINTIERLQHPNIVCFLGHERGPQTISIFYEYVPGGTISDILSKFKKLGEGLISHFSRQILGGVVYLHDLMMIHQNLRCDNILLDADGTCKITGFSSAKQMENIYADDPNNSPQGSIFWMAPEVVQQGGQGYSGKVDIWSLGCCTLEMFSASRPWSQYDKDEAAEKLKSLQSPDIPEHLYED